MESRDQEPAANLTAQLLSITKRCDLHAKAAAEGLPEEFGQVDDVIMLLQPLLLAANEDQGELQSTLQRLAEKNFLTGSQALDDSSLAAALICACVPRGLGFHVELAESEGATAIEALLEDRRGCALVTARPKAHLPLANFAERGGRFSAEAIGRVTAGDIRVKWMGETLLEIPRLNAD